MIRYFQAELPARIKAFTVRKDGEYTIVVNSILAREQQLKEINHELYHIAEGHLDSDLPIDYIEILATDNTQKASPVKGGL